MVKSFLIKTSAPFCGSDNYYAAYAENEDELLDWLYSNWFDEECDTLYNEYYGFFSEDYEDEWEETFDEYSDRSEFDDIKYEDWCTNCSLEVSECPEEELKDYAPDGCTLEIIYDKRND